MSVLSETATADSDVVWRRVSAPWFVEVRGAPMFPWSTVGVGGVPFAAASRADAVGWLLQLLRSGGELDRAIPVRLMNAYCVALTSEQPEYLALVTGPGVNFPDGAPVAFLMRRLGARAAQQVRGPSFFVDTIARGQNQGVRHFFFGTTRATLDALEEALRARHPDVVIAGSAEAVFGTVDEILSQEVVQVISAAQPDLVWVGLGTPKQDFVAARLADKLGRPCVGVGAAFDFAAGTQPEAPELVRRIGFEWMYRLASEPRRLWRRYLWGNTRFISLGVRQLTAVGRGR